MTAGITIKETTTAGITNRVIVKKARLTNENTYNAGGVESPALYRPYEGLFS
jgi:hypothetical protein